MLPSVTRATPDGDEVVRGPLPALVSVRSELGAPRFPSAKAKMAARKMAPSELTTASLGLDSHALNADVVLSRQFVPTVQGNCEFLAGSPAEVAQQLLARLRADKTL